MLPVFVQALNLIDVEFTVPPGKRVRDAWKKLTIIFQVGAKDLGAKASGRQKPSRKSISTLRTQLAEAGSFFRSEWRDITLFTLRTSMDRR